MQLGTLSHTAPKRRSAGRLAWETLTCLSLSVCAALRLLFFINAKFDCFYYDTNYGAEVAANTLVK